MEKEQSILVVEDDLGIQEIICTLIKRCGYIPFCAKSGEEMWKQLNKCNPRLLIMDIGLPDTDGLTLVKEFKSEKKRARTPIIVVTAFADLDMIDLRQQALSVGCNDFIDKPFDPMVLLETMQKHLPEWKHV